jgi:hypothetical protein
MVLCLSRQTIPLLIMSCIIGLASRQIVGAKMLFYLTPMISGAALFGIALLVVFLRAEIQPPLMVLSALAAVLISLPAIKKFQLTKEGFSIEPAEGRNVRTGSAPPDRSSASEIYTEHSTRIKLVPAMGLFYGTISGVLSATLGTLFYFKINPMGPIPQLVPAWPAPPLPAALFSLALFFLFLGVRSVGKLQLLLIPFFVYGAWTAALRIAISLGQSVHYPAEIAGPIAGLVGGLLLTLGLCIFAKELRSPKAILVTTILAGGAGILLALPIAKYHSYAPLYFPLFVGWQGLVSMSIAYFMVLNPKN